MARDDWESVMIKKSRWNGLKEIAARENRSASKQADWILMKAGVPELSDSELERRMKSIRKKEEGEILIAGKQ